MEARQVKMLISLIDEYIKKAAPVASGFLAGRGDFKLSSATIRNEMAVLEEAGYICQPHTSAGRIPTELGYNFYLENLDKNIKISEKDKKVLDDSYKSKDYPEKKVAKALAEISGEAAILAFGKNDVYYTGLSNLFSKPEFSDRNLVCKIGEVVDEMDETIHKIFDEVEDKVKVFAGSKNPFSDNCSLIITRYKKGKGVLAVLGPIRMNYKKNIGLVKYAKELLDI
jgi:heat-inducible transcriptional repressor